MCIRDRGSANVLDTTQDRNTTDATTSPYRRCKVRVPTKYPLRQLDSTVKESTGEEDLQGTEQDFARDNLRHHGSNWAYNNIHPLASYWILISTDDQTAIGSTVTGDSVQVKCIRRLAWQDRLA